MTRINAGIRARLLTDEHLLAEHREIKRIPSLFKKRLESSKFDDIPKVFSLGSGHVKFFLDKGDYTCGRYEELRYECINRNFTVTDYFDNWKI